MTRKRKANPQKALSKQWLADALVRLLATMPYQDITITAITAEADLARRTFYRHFATVDEVLNYDLTGICQDFIDELADLTALDFETLIIRFFTFWNERRDFLKLLQQNNLEYRLLQVFMPQLRDRLIGQIAEADIYDFIAGGLWNLLMGSLRSETAPTTAELQALATRILQHLSSTPQINQAHFKN